MAIRRTLPVWITVLALLVAGCPEDQVLTSTRNLSRPGPLALVCSARTGDASAPTGLTASHCTSDAGVGGSVKGTLFGFVANTARGEVAVFRPGSSGERLVDLDPGSPGFGFIPVGSFPTDLESTQDGCRVATANSGSCDLSVIDVPSVMKVAAGELKIPTGAVVSGVIPRTTAGPLRARPQELVLVPPTKAKAPTAACSRDQELRAYVTFPRCNLVAEVDLKTGQVLQGVVLLPGGDYITKSPSCAAECIMRGDPARPDIGTSDLKPTPDKMLPDKTAPTLDGASDAKKPTTDGASADAGVDSSVSPDSSSGATDAGVGSSADVLPYGLAYSHTDNQLYVSSAGAGFVSVIDIDPSTRAFKTVRRVQLGVATTRIKLSPKTRRLGRFLYVIARDRSVRVISTATLKQCETNLDLAKAPEAGVPLSQAGCMVKGATGTLPRRVTADAPGLRFGSWIPREVTFVTGPEVKSDAAVVEAGPGATPMQGVFALIALSDGTIHVVDVEDWNVIKSSTAKVPALHLSHRLRNAHQGTDLGLPKLKLESVSGASTGGIPVVVAKTDKDLPNQGIYLRAPGVGVASSWNLIYEDALLGRWSGSLKVTGDKLLLDDPGATYCASGVEARSQTKGGLPERHGDIAVLVGCKDDNECGLEQVCAKSVSNPTNYGLCIEKSKENEMFTKCLSFLNAEREYLVTRATSKQLTLDILPVEPQKIIKQSSQTAKCTANSDCTKHHMCALKAQAIPGQVALAKGDCFRTGCTVDADCGSNHRCVQPLDGTPRVCSLVPLPFEKGPSCDSTAADPDAACRPKVKAGAKCSEDKDCKDGRLECRKPNSAATERVCVSKDFKCARFAGLKNICVRISPCFTQLLRYDVRAGRSFVMGGYKRRRADPVTGECADNTSQNALFNNRIPVGLPIYPVILGPRCNPASPAPLRTPSANACFDEIATGYTGFTSRSGDNYISVTGDGPATVVRFGNPDLWFSLGVSHLTTAPVVEGATDAGVATASSTPPMPKRNLVLKLDVASGFSALKVNSGTLVSLPTRLVEGPDGYVYIVDEGDTAGGTGNNGQVVRFVRANTAMDTFQVR